jgi:hypothetical protein
MFRWSPIPFMVTGTTPNETPKSNMHAHHMKTANSNPSHLIRLTDGVFAARKLWNATFLFCCLSFSLTAAESERIRLVRTPEGGIQPQSAVDSKGVVHLIYYRGEGRGGDIFYVREEPGQETF